MDDKRRDQRKDQGPWSEATMAALYARRRKYGPEELARLEKSWAEDDHIKRLGLWEGP